MNGKRHGPEKSMVKNFTGDGRSPRKNHGEEGADDGRMVENSMKTEAVEEKRWRLSFTIEHSSGQNGETFGQPHFFHGPSKTNTQDRIRILDRVRRD